MPSYYCVVRYVPDPIKEEQINIGVIVFGYGCVRTRFTTNWQRVYNFGDNDIGFLKDFVSQAARLTERRIREIADRWINTIQLTQPRASELTLEALLKDVAQRYLGES